MSSRVGRNDPCPCGSGKKHKKCCERNEISTGVDPAAFFSPRFKFETGSYGGGQHFMPSIICLKEVSPDQWINDYVLVRGLASYENEKGAAEQAVRDIELAFRERKKTGNDFAVAEKLSSKGYIRVTDYKIVDE